MYNMFPRHRVANHIQFRMRSSCFTYRMWAALIAEKRACCTTFIEYDSLHEAGSVDARPVVVAYPAHIELRK